ncbi:MAG: hypothetical protein WCT54_01700 [Patescibacteria group bacterium]|jgi:hypothetical protein
MQKQFSKTLMLGLILASLGAGCSSQNTSGDTSKTGSTSGKSYDPCELITLADFSADFPNQTLTQDKHDTTANAVGQKICFYGSKDDMYFVQLSIISNGDIPASKQANGLTAQSQYEQILSMIAGANSVDGIGDGAYYAGSGLGIGRGLSVLDNAHGVYFTIDIGLGVGNDDQVKHLTMEKNLAQKVLERL